MENKGRKISFSWAATLGILFATLFMILFATAYKLPQIFKYEADVAGRISQKDMAFLEKSAINSEDEAPYLESGLSGIYYTGTADGKIAFYKFKDGKYERFHSSSTISVKLPGATSSTEINLISANGQTIGLGVYSDKQSKTFPYAFIKVIPNKVTDNYDYIAFVDKSIPDYYNNTKSYESAYAFSKGDKVELIFDLDEDKAFIPIELIAERNDGFYYFTKNDFDDFYSLYIKNTIHDKPAVMSSEVAIPCAFSRDNELYILERNKQSTAEFCLALVSGFENTILKEFNYPATSYVVKGNYILDTNGKTLYDVQSGAEQVINSAISLAGVEDFSVSEGASKLALAGKFAGNNEKLFFYEFATEKILTVDSHNLFLSGNPNISFIGNYVTFLSPAKTADNVINIAIKWNDIM